MYSDFILGKDIGSVGQSYFQGDGKENVMNWLRKNKELISKIRNIEGSIDDRIEIYQRFQSGVLNAGKRNCWMSVHAMIVALQPEFLCNILSEPKLDRLYELLEYLASEPDEDNSGQDEEGQNKGNDSSRVEITLTFDDKWKSLQEEWKTATEKDISISWYYKSAAIYNYFNSDGVKEDVNSDTPWQVYVALNGDERVKMMAKRLELQKNIILTGAPGTGKTYLAHRIAAEMIGCKENELKCNGNKQFEFVQFHPSYDYTDFVEGLRPINKDNNIVFERKDGIFKAFCAEAAIAEKVDTIKPENEKQKQKFVFIIDEINRGEIAKIFGELFFSIDPGYRGEFDDKQNDNKVKTQYQNLISDSEKMPDGNNEYPFINGFYVPKNVYVIGTMNDIDRSVESMDFAFRRRFAFIEISAEDSEIIINNSGIDEGKQQELITKMENLNNAIIDPEKGGLSSEYQIGGAYFLKYKDVRNNYNRLWDEYLKGVLLEYYRGNPQQKAILKMLKEAYDSKEDSKKKGKAAPPTP